VFVDGSQNPDRQSVSTKQLVLQAVDDAHARFLAQGAAAAAPHGAETPSHVALVNTPLAHVGPVAEQLVPAGLYPHAPALHRTAQGPVGQIPCGSAIPVTGEQVPTVPVRLQDWQAPVHATLQHTPSTQFPLRHSVPAEHDAPLVFSPTHTPPTHAAVPLAQSAAEEHPVAHAPVATPHAV
jgi:hypothetical protein